MNHKYKDIIEMPYEGKKTGERLSMLQRGAQFAPFAALTGHGDAIRETARITDRKIDLSDYERSILDQKLAQLLENINLHPTAEITYFIADLRKGGGSYTTFTSQLKKWNEHDQELTFTNGKTISISQIIDIE